MGIIGGFDTKDRVKIRDRTRRITPDLGAYDYRLHFVHEATDGAFAFLALGDAGAKGRKHPMKYRVADTMEAEPGVHLILHLGDVVYLSGSKEGYGDRFIRAYYHWLQRGRAHRHDDMVFTTPFLPVYGNHDYYDLKRAIRIPILGKIIGAIAEEVSDEIGSGSKNGQIFADAFIADDLRGVQDGVLPYRTGEATRLPNRYYWFTHGPCAFFALDSNTLDGVENPSDAERPDLERRLDEARQQVELRQFQLEKLERHIEAGGVLEEIIDPAQVEATLHQIIEELTEAEKQVVMLEKYLGATGEDFDRAQLAWLDAVLQHPDVQGKWKVVYLHHPLYSSEGSHTDDLESIGLRKNLRRLFVEHGVNLVLSGHSHCFEWLTRAPTGAGPEAVLAEAERRICYVVSGGGGRELRRSVLEDAADEDGVAGKQRQFFEVAESRAFTAITGGEHIHHYLRVDVSEETLTVTPVGVVERGGQTHRESPIRTKVFTRNGDRIDVAEQRLTRIKVFRDKEPEAE